MPDGLMHYVITSTSYGLFYNDTEYYPGSQIAQWAHTSSADDRQMKFKYVGTVDGTEGEYFVSTGTTWVKKLFLFPTFIDKGSVGTAAQPELPQATEENRNWCYKVATTKKYRIGQDKWITIDFKYMEYTAKWSQYESMSPVMDQHKNDFFSNEYTTIEYECIQIRFTQTPTGYFKYTSTCWYNGKVHKDIYFNGNYHDALWLYKIAWNCDGYEWKKYLTDPRYSRHYLLADHQSITPYTTYKGIGEVSDTNGIKSVRNNYRYYSTSSTQAYQILAMHKMYDTNMANIVVVPFLDVYNSRNYRLCVMVYYGVDGGLGLHRAISSFCNVGGRNCYVVSCYPGGVTIYCSDDKKFYNLQIFRGGSFGLWTSWNADPEIRFRSDATGTMHWYTNGNARYYADGRSIGFASNTYGTTTVLRYDPSDPGTFTELVIATPDQEEIPIPFPQDGCLRELAYKMFENKVYGCVPFGYSVTKSTNKESFDANGNYYFKMRYTVTYTRDYYYGPGGITKEEAIAAANEVRDTVYDNLNPYQDYGTNVQINDESLNQNIHLAYTKNTDIFLGYNAMSATAVDLYDLHDLSIYKNALGDVITTGGTLDPRYLINCDVRPYYLNDTVYLYMSFLNNSVWDSTIGQNVRPCRDIYVVRMGNPEMDVIKTYADESHLTVKHFTNPSQPDLTINFDGWLGYSVDDFTPVENSFGNWAGGNMINVSMETFSVTADPGDEWHFPGNTNTRLMLGDGTRMLMSTSADMNTLNTTWYATSLGA